MTEQTQTNVERGISRMEKIVAGTGQVLAISGIITAGMPLAASTIFPENQFLNEVSNFYSIGIGSLVVAGSLFLGLAVKKYREIKKNYTI